MNSNQDIFMEKLIVLLEEKEDLRKINNTLEKLVSNYESEIHYLKQVIELQNKFIANSEYGFQASKYEIQTVNSTSKENVVLFQDKIKQLQAKNAKLETDKDEEIQKIKAEYQKQINEQKNAAAIQKISTNK